MLDPGTDNDSSFRSDQQIHNASVEYSAIGSLAVGSKEVVPADHEQVYWILQNRRLAVLIADQRNYTGSLAVSDKPSDFHISKR